MKKLFSILVALSIGTFAIAQPPAGDANPGDTYGDKITATDAVSISEIPAKLATSEKIDTKIRAKVLDVCPKAGCWLKLAVNDTTTAFVKMKDYAFFCPSAIKGKTIILDGVANIKTTSVEELKHYAEDAKKSREEIAAITKPSKEIRFLANGILVEK